MLTIIGKMKRLLVLLSLVFTSHVIIAHKYRGNIWLYRGQLAERLNRLRMAERAYQRALEKGWSLYACERLISIYTMANNLEAAFDYIKTVLDYFARRKGIKVYKGLPGWIENAIFKLIAINGYKKVRKMVPKTNANKKYDCLEACLSKAREIHIYKTIF